MVHDCVQDAKIRQLCLDVGIHKEKLRVIDAGLDEIFQGDGSMKSRLTRAENGIGAIEKEIKDSFAGFKWFIGILVAIQIAAFGGFSAFICNQIPEKPQQIQTQSTNQASPEYSSAEGGEWGEFLCKQ